MNYEREGVQFNHRLRQLRDCDVYTNGEEVEPKYSETFSAYSHAWLKKGNKICVDQRCLMEFSIEEQLQNQVWCDVVHIDICHILL